MSETIFINPTILIYLCQIEIKRPSRGLNTKRVANTSIKENSSPTLELELFFLKFIIRPANTCTVTYIANVQEI